MFAEIDDCNPDPCENGGRCIDGLDTYICDCVLGYTGDNCESGIAKFL